VTGFHLAQLNVARLRAPLDSPTLADFVALLPEINARGDAAPGFVWRLTGEAGDDATSLRPFGDDLIVNLTVWQSPETLSAFVYRSAHLEPMRRRREWFERMSGPHLVLWWVPAGHRPDLHEAGRRLAELERHGPTPTAFTLIERFPPPVNSPAGPAADVMAQPAPVQVDRLHDPSR
jgi:hypothetical protein